MKVLKFYFHGKSANLTYFSMGFKMAVVEVGGRFSQLYVIFMLGSNM